MQIFEDRVRSTRKSNEHIARVDPYNKQRMWCIELSSLIQMNVLAR